MPDTFPERRAHAGAEPADIAHGRALDGHQAHQDHQSQRGRALPAVMLWGLLSISLPSGTVHWV